MDPDWLASTNGDDSATFVGHADGPNRSIRPFVVRGLARLRGRRGKIVEPGANALGRALYAPLFESPEQPPNSARFTFLDPAAQQFFRDWEKAAKDLVATLRSAAGRNPHDRALSDLVGELSMRSEPFRKWWAAHDVRYHQTDRRRLHHPTVGDLELEYEVMEVSADSGLRLAVFSAEPGTRSAEAVDLLASWIATPDSVPPRDDARRT